MLTRVSERQKREFALVTCVQHALEREYALAPRVRECLEHEFAPAPRVGERVERELAVAVSCSWHVQLAVWQLLRALTDRGPTLITLASYEASAWRSQRVEKPDSLRAELLRRQDGIQIAQREGEGMLQ
jgi:hypothetical protein